MDLKDLFKAINIFLKYGNVENPIECEHDVLYVHVSSYKVSNDDKKELTKLGFDPVDNKESFVSYV
jgi:hypothetical protein